MKRFFLDTSALLTLRDDEPGAERLVEILQQVQKDKMKCVGCFMTQMEILYRVWRDEGETAGRLALEQLLLLPISWMHETPELLEKAAEIKATHRVSLADAWIAAGAILSGAILLHKDPEFQALSLAQEILPFKNAGS